MAAKSALPLPFKEWPPNDQKAWLEAIAIGDEYDPGGDGANWGLRSRENAFNSYGRYLAFLKRSGRLDIAATASDRVQASDICSFARELWSQLAPYSVIGVLGSLGSAFKALAPKTGREPINALIGRLERRAHSVRDIEANLISPRELDRIGVELMDEAEASTSRRMDWRFCMFRDGLLVSFLANCPLRPGAVVDMRFGVHLIQENGTFRVHFPQLANHKRRIEDVPLPPQVASRFVRLSEFYYPAIAGAQDLRGQPVWLSCFGHPLDRVTLSKCLRERLRPETGKTFTAHMFRHAAATFIAEETPERALMIAAVLGHSGFRTAKKHYIKGQQIAQYKLYHELVAELRLRHDSSIILADDRDSELRTDLDAD